MALGPAAGAGPAAATGSFDPDGVAGDGEAAERLVLGERLAMAWSGRGDGDGGWKCWGQACQASRWNGRSAVRFPKVDDSADG